MAKTNITGDQILDGTVGRPDLDTATTGEAVITKLVAGTNVTLTWTGSDVGTGDVTVNFVGGGGGTVVWQPKQINAVRLLLTLKTLSKLLPAVKLSQAPSKLVSTMKPAVLLKTVVTGTIKPQLVPAVKMRTILTQKTPPSVLDATKLQYFLNLNGVYGGASQTNSGWTNGANALGKHDSANATVASSVTVATGGALVLIYAALTNKTALSISAVTLSIYGSQAGTVLANGNYKVEYSINGGTNWTVLFTQTGDFTNSLSNDINGVVGSNWSNLANFQVRVTASYPSGTIGITANLDAVELNVVAATAIITP